jgi:S-(hydroxymethyl)mycothiol dehydrogenase
VAVDRAVLLTGPGESARVEAVTLDEPGPGEVAVRMLAVGVCHSDLYVKETGGWGMKFPIALGHEGCGVVEAVGAEVEEPQPGERVVLAWRSACGRCPACERGAPRLCPSPLRARRRMHRAADGAVVTPTLLCGCFADRVVVHAGQAIPVPAELPAEQACLLGCAAATGVGAALNTAPVWEGAHVAVIGCGGVGLSVVQGARIAGAAEILALDREPGKLDWARRLGATETATAAPPDRRFHFVFDAVGAPATLEQAVAMLDHGGIATLIGLPHEDSVAAFDLHELFDARAQLRVSHGGDILPAEDLPLLAAHALEGRLDLASMVTDRISLDDVEEAFGAMARGETIRSVVLL